MSEDRRDREKELNDFWDIETDWNKVDAILDDQRNQSLQFLKETLAAVKEQKSHQNGGPYAKDTLRNKI